MDRFQCAICDCETSIFSAKLVKANTIFLMDGKPNSEPMELCPACWKIMIKVKTVPATDIQPVKKDILMGGKVNEFGPPTPRIYGQLTCQVCCEHTEFLSGGLFPGANAQVARQYVDNFETKHRDCWIRNLVEIFQSSSNLTYALTQHRGIMGLGERHYRLLKDVLECVQRPIWIGDSITVYCGEKRDRLYIGQLHEFIQILENMEES